MKIRKSIPERVFNVFNIIFMIGLMIITVYPFWYVLCGSFSDPGKLIAFKGLLVKPVGFSLDGYISVMKNQEIFTGYKNTLIYILVGTTLSVLATALLAYPLSRKNLRYKKQIMLFIVITMFFNGGLIPTYLVVRSLHMLDTIWAMVIPGLVGTYNMVVLRTAFEGVPESLIESAKIDGATEIKILFSIIIPLSKAAIAVMVLFYGVAKWNSWFNAMIYLQDRSNYPLQLILREILIESANSDMLIDTGTGSKASLEQVVKYATVIVSTVPILAVYPFLQKYFVKGVMVGAVKG